MTPSLPHLTHPPQSDAEWLEALLKLARYLRSPDGCPWDREQSAADFARYLAEETGELREALDGGRAGDIEEEFGDVVFTVLAAGAAAEEGGLFTMTSALKRIHEKMIRRHEHVFGHARAETPEDAVRIWKAVKDREKAVPPPRPSCPDDGP